MCHMKREKGILTGVLKRPKYYYLNIDNNKATLTTKEKEKVCDIKYQEQ